LSDSGTPSPDWDSVFHRARRRIFGRIAVVAAIAGLGALFLLGGGLSAQGTVSWRVLGHQDEAKSETTPKKQKKIHNGKPSQGKPQDKNDQGHSGNKHPKKKQPPPNKKKHHPHWNPCAEESAAAVEYCEPGDDNSPTEPPEPTAAEEGT
jgi:hypothetical protein